MADQQGVTQVELRHDLVEIRGEGVVVVARGRLTGFAEAPAVVGDGPITCLEQGHYLLLPGSAAQRKAVDEHDGATRAVVLVVEIDRPRVLLTNIDVWHERFLPSGSAIKAEPYSDRLQSFGRLVILPGKDVPISL